MINIVNIDLTNTSCWGICNAAGVEDNQINLYIKILEGLSNIQLEFTKPDGAIVIIPSTNLIIENKQVKYEMPFNLYTTKGKLKLKILATDYRSEYITFNIIDNYIIEDDICVKFNATTKEFSINKCLPVENGQVKILIKRW